MKKLDIQYSTYCEATGTFFLKLFSVTALLKWCEKITVNYYFLYNIYYSSLYEDLTSLKFLRICSSSRKPLLNTIHFNLSAIPFKRSLFPVSRNHLQIRHSFFFSFDSAVQNRIFIFSLSEMRIPFTAVKYSVHAQYAN